VKPNINSVEVHLDGKLNLVGAHSEQEEKTKNISLSPLHTPQRKKLDLSKETLNPKPSSH
jgi:hypothetical protein